MTKVSNAVITLIVALIVLQRTTTSHEIGLKCDPLGLGSHSQQPNKPLRLLTDHTTHTPMNITLHSQAGAHSAIKKGNGPVVLCLHGFPDNNSAYDFQIDALVDAGFTVVVPTLRGYEPSSIPSNSDYSLFALADDVESWRKELGVDTFHLIGHDWGALTSYIYAAQYGQHLASLTTFAIPPLHGLENAILTTPKQWLNSWYIAFFQLRYVSDKRFAKNDFALLNTLWRNWSPGWQAPAERIEKVKDSFRQNGVTNATLGYYRQLIKDVLTRRASQELKHPITVPTFVMAGKQDGCLSEVLFPKSIMPSRFPAGIEYKAFEQAGHFLHQEIPDTINPLLIEWLQRHKA